MEELEPSRLMRDTQAIPPYGGKAAFAEKADDLEEIKKAVDDAAAVSGGLWLSYLFILFYIAIAAGAVTHIDLLLQQPVHLPFLNTNGNLHGLKHGIETCLLRDVMPVRAASRVHSSSAAR
jgi:hypothetical protein